MKNEFVCFQMIISKIICVKYVITDSERLKHTNYSCQCVQPINVGTHDSLEYSGFTNIHIRRFPLKFVSLIFSDLLKWWFVNLSIFTYHSFLYSGHSYFHHISMVI